MAALGTFIAGRYSATWNSVDIGIMEQGYEVQFDPKWQMINRSDAFGDMLIDMILRGGDWNVQCDSLEYKAGPISVIAMGGTLGVIGIIGRLASSMAQALVLTSTAGTPAAATPATLTAPGAILAANANVRLLFNSELRKVPMRFAVLPYAGGGGAITHIVST